MKTYYVTYWATNGQPHNTYATYHSRRDAIAAARRAVVECLPVRSGGRVEVTDGDETDNFGNEAIWVWLEHPEGGFGHHRANGNLLAAVRGLRR